MLARVYLADTVPERGNADPPSLEATRSGAAAQLDETRLELPELDLIAEVLGDRLRIFTGSGDLLDPVAAQVLQSLGGTAPSWLRNVEGLHTVWGNYRNTTALRSTAAALAKPDPQRAQIARTTLDPAVVIGLAAAGVPAVAQNPHCTAQAWDLLRLHDDEEVQERAWDLADVLPPSLASHPDANTRALAARNLACPRQTLDGLASDPSETVLLAVAGNPNTSGRALRRIARQKNLYIRAAVAANPSFSVHSYRAESLLLDRDGTVLAGFASRTNVSGHFLHRVNNLARTRSRRYRTVLVALRNNPRTPKRLLRKATEGLKPKAAKGKLSKRITLINILVVLLLIGFIFDPKRNYAVLILVAARFAYVGLRGVVRTGRNRKR